LEWRFTLEFVKAGRATVLKTPVGDVTLKRHMNAQVNTMQNLEVNVECVGKLMGKIVTIRTLNSNQ
jgi:hypothetical protein